GGVEGGVTAGALLLEPLSILPGSSPPSRARSAERAGRGWPGAAVAVTRPRRGRRPGRLAPVPRDDGLEYSLSGKDPSWEESFAGPASPGWRGWAGRCWWASWPWRPTSARGTGSGPGARGAAQGGAGGQRHAGGGAA